MSGDLLWMGPLNVASYWTGAPERQIECVRLTMDLSYLHDLFSFHTAGTTDEKKSTNEREVSGFLSVLLHFQFGVELQSAFLCSPSAEFDLHFYLYCVVLWVVFVCLVIVKMWVVFNCAI